MIITLRDKVISWGPSKQQQIAKRTAESEVIIAAMAALRMQKRRAIFFDLDQLFLDIIFLNTQHGLIKERHFVFYMFINSTQIKNL